MFQWDKSIDSIQVTADKVVHLFRSMREVQLALPGVPAQGASAYLCQYRVDKGIATTAVFHLHKSEVLAFYFSDSRVVQEQGIDAMLDQTLNFVESMGFLMTDQDIHLLDESDQEMLWSSLPLKEGLRAKEEPASAVAAAKSGDELAAPKDKTKTDAASAKGQASSLVETSFQDVADEFSGAIERATPAEPEKKPKKLSEETTPESNVDDLLAAVEAMRAKRPGLRARKSMPSEEEMSRRKLLLRETVGRILASL